MSGSQFKHSNKSNVIYPGASQKVKFEQRNKTHHQDNTKTPIKNYTEKGPSIESTVIDDEKLTNQYAGLREKTFELDWVDYDYRKNTTSNKSLSENYKVKSKLKTASEQKLSASKQRVGKIAADHRPYVTMSGALQSDPVTSQIPVSPGSGLYQGSSSDSTALDMSRELTNQSSGDYLEGQDLDGQLADGAPEVKQRLSDDYNRLDEPIMDTLVRDLSGIYNKMKIIALPLSSYDIYKVVLRGWDLWGPLLLCTFLAFNLHHSGGDDNHVGPHFADVFVLVWLGSCVVSLNYKLLSITSVNNQAISSPMINSGNVMQQSSSSSFDDTNVGDLTSVREGSGENHSKIMMSQYSAPFQTLLSPPSIFQLMCVFGYCLVAPCFGLIMLKIFSFNRLYFERIIVGLLFGFAWPTFCSVRILIRYQHPDKRALAIYPIGLFYFVLSCMIILNH